MLEKNTKILFCNIAYMKYYDMELDGNSIPKHGGKYVTEMKDALEKNNFHVCKDGFVRGFVETKYKDGYKKAKQPNQLHIERIHKDYKNKNEIPNVIVIFCAKSDIVGKTVIIGWYQNAIVYRGRKEYGGRQYNIKPRAEDCYRIEELDRKMEVPRAKNNLGTGFGQANIWYANEENAESIVHNIIKYINNLQIESIGKYFLNENDKYNESGIGYPILVNRYERNPNARKKCIELQGSTCKICGFNASVMYGEEFKGKIHVHHIKPINEIDTDYKINPETDLIPICPNCHMIIHTAIKGRCLNVDELIERIKLRQR